MQSLLGKFRLHVSSEQRRRREKKLPYRFRFALFHFIFSTSELLIKFDTSESIFLHFMYPSDFVSFYFGALQAWVRRFICVGRLKAEIRYRKVILKRYKSKQILYFKILWTWKDLHHRISFEVNWAHRKGNIHNLFSAPEILGYGPQNWIITAHLQRGTKVLGHLFA